MDKNIVFNNIPSSNRNNFGHRAINSSHEHNENQERMLNDILDIYNKCNMIEKVVNQNMEYIKYENNKIESINYELLKKFKDLSNKYNDIKNKNINRENLITTYDCSTNDSVYGAVIDKKCCDITVRPSLKVSKVSIIDSVSDSVFLPNTLNVDVRGDSLGVISETDNDIYAPFYNDNNLYWTRKVITDNTVESIFTEYIITLPEEIMTTPEINEILISPFICKVVSVHYRYGDSSIWEAVPGQEYNEAIDNNTDHFESYVNSIRPFKLNFKNIKANQIKITIKSEQYVESETNLRNFMFGLKQVAIFQNYYNNHQPSNFEFETTINEVNNVLVTGIETNFNNGSKHSEYSKDILYDIYYKSISGDYHKILDDFPFNPPTNDLKIKCSFGERNYDTNVKNIVIKYKII